MIALLGEESRLVVYSRSGGQSITRLKRFGRPFVGIPRYSGRVIGGSLLLYRYIRALMLNAEATVAAVGAKRIP